MKAVIVIILATSTLTFAQQRSRFDSWDKNKDGKLSKEELPAGAQRNFEKVDRNGDGSISREEEKAFLNRGRKPGAGEKITLQRDLDYSGDDNPRQKLDLLLPKARSSEKPLPVVVFIHGGAWRAGDKRSGIGRLRPLVESGDYAGVTVGYRLSAEAKWPAQIHDCKAAIRWIRAHAKEHNLDPENIGVWGTSAGGHLVAMLGVSGDVEALEGKVGKHLDQDSRVDCVINFFGPAELLTMNDHDSTMDHNAPDSPESILIDGPIQENKDKARAASPTTYVTKDDAPILNVHGTSDKLVPYPQSVDFNTKLNATGVSSTLITIKGGGHGNFGEATSKVEELVSKFLEKHLKETGDTPEIKSQTLKSSG